MQLHMLHTAHIQDIYYIQHIYRIPKIPRPPLAQEHSLVKLEAGKLTSSSPTDTAGITSPTALLGLALCQHRKLQDDSRTVRIQAPTGSRRPLHRSIRPYCPTQLSQPTGANAPRCGGRARADTKNLIFGNQQGNQGTVDRAPSDTKLAQKVSRFLGILKLAR